MAYSLQAGDIQPSSQAFRGETHYWQTQVDRSTSQALNQQAGDLNPAWLAMLPYLLRERETRLPFSFSCPKAPAVLRPAKALTSHTLRE